MKQKVHNYNIKDINKWFWIKNTIIILIFSYFIFINIAKPNNYLKYTWHYGIWAPITSYVVFWEGRKYFKLYPKLFKKIMDMDTLIGLSSHILYIFSIYMAITNWNMPMYSYQQMWEGPAILIAVTNIGRFLENKIENSSLEAYQKLDNMRHAEVIVIKNKKHIKDVTSNLKIGDVILVKKGEIIPLEGTISQDGSFDYSNITGESRTIILKKGQEVISGSYNLGNVIKIKITKNPSESTLATLVDKIENVSMARPKLQKFADKILRWFVPVVIIIAITTAIVWTIIAYNFNFLFPWINSNSLPWVIGIEAGVTVMAIACPCALGIATPLVYAISSLLSAKKGIMINDPKSLEELSKIKTFAFDKTGTITDELFEVSSMEGDKKLIGVAKSLEKHVKHPIAQTIISLKGKFAKVTNIKHLDTKVVGNYQDNIVEIKASESRGVTTNIGLYINDEIKLIFRLKNKIKSGVKETIRTLKSKGIKTIMITGDNKNVAESIAKKVGIDKVYYEVKPTQKADIIKEIQGVSKVAFVGDGFNDSLSMKQANVSIAFASGSDITNSLSDISILKNDFYSIANLLNLSKMNNKSVKLSLIYAFSFNMFAIPLAISFLVEPWMGASIMALSDILVVLNAFIYKKLGNRKLI